MGFDIISLASLSINRFVNKLRGRSLSDRIKTTGRLLERRRLVVAEIEFFVLFC